ncbi:outer membrane beta-barrel domain-containing protein [Bdellovibrio sp. NC01]|uniref:outer membrane beta-barrel domain-containing protein n=1 Tax=Bdellovibrio sp. NC01 TaxID=2220073 RepID=UPI001FED5C41|nr:outer membrane beta-barrel domain-containing protein [Bdellovibrio sp. NC01]
MFKKAFLTIILMASSALAQQGDKQAEQRGSDKLDIKKLEQKYWAAKDDDFSVVQNRRYVKAERFYLTAEGGIPFNDPYSTGSIFGASFGYFFNERWGVEANYNSANMKDNDAVDQFVTQYGAIPDHNIFKSSYFLSGTFVPFYAKMSFMDKSIIYFDMGLSLGVGSVNYEIAKNTGNESKNAFGVKLGIFQQIFFSEHFAVRVDLNNTWSNQDQAKYYTPGSALPGGGTAGANTLGSKTINDTSLMFGLTYWH